MAPVSQGKSRLIFTVAASVTVIAIIVFIIWRLPKGEGPSYQGRSLSQWVDRIDDNGMWPGVVWETLPKKTAKQLEAAEAIRAIGTNGIPFLLEGFHATNSTFYQK